MLKLKTKRASKFKVASPTRFRRFQSTQPLSKSFLKDISQGKLPIITSDETRPLHSTSTQDSNLLISYAKAWPILSTSSLPKPWLKKDEYYKRSLSHFLALCAVHYQRVLRTPASLPCSTSTSETKAERFTPIIVEEMTYPTLKHSKNRVIIEEIPHTEPSSSKHSDDGATEMVKESDTWTKMLKQLDGANSNKKDTILEDEEIDLWMMCAIIPQDYEFGKDKLVQLWAALLESDLVRDQTLIFGHYFDALVKEGFIQKTRTIFPRGENKYKVNGGMLIHSMTTLKDKVKSFYLKATKFEECLGEEVYNGLQYLSIELDHEITRRSTIFDQIKKLKDLKVLLSLGGVGCHEILRATMANDVHARKNIVEIPHDIFLALKHLRVLDLSNVPIIKLPSSIGEAKELRYLDVSNSFIEELPETIAYLKNLQTLRLRDCLRLWRLPEGIVKLSALLYLDLDILGQLSFLPRGIGALTNLQTLSAFPINEEDGCHISELKEMNSLRGMLCVSHLERVFDIEEAEEARLSHKMYLNEVELRWGEARSKRVNVKQHDYEVLHHLRPPTTLEKLEISGYGGSKFPDWLSKGSLLPTLISITLISCENIKHLPSLGELPSLRVLRLIHIKKVEQIDEKFLGRKSLRVSFPALEELVIVGMSSLKTWKEGMKGDFPCLSKLTIEQCPKLVAIPPLSGFGCLRQLEISRCRKLSSMLNHAPLPSSLDTIIIENCPLIQKRCHKTRGKYWHVIKTIQNVWVN